MTKVTVSCEIGGTTLSLTTGEIAKQASGAVVVQYGETVLLVATQTGPARPGIDFFPLSVDYRERYAAAGKFAGGYLKREGRPSTREILTCRLTDRPLRPLFPKGYKDEVQIQCNVLAADDENDPTAFTILGASAGLGLSDAPFQGPVAGVRVGLCDGELVVFPTLEQMEGARLDLIVAGHADAVTMIEGFGDQIPEDEMADAIQFAHEQIKALCKLQEEFHEKCGATKSEWEQPAENPFTGMLMERAYDRIKEAKQNPVKADRYAAGDAIRDELIAEIFPDDAEETAEGHTLGQFKEAFYKITSKAVRDLLLQGIRLDGRQPNELRDVTSIAGYLPRVHGSALFTRGETQSLATVVLGTPRDKQKADTLFGETEARFMLHYYFPSYSVGEVRPIRGPGRREIGHGALAERSVEWVLPPVEKFPYTIRVLSDITESNGSSSMASVCSATLSLMDAGVPISKPVAGISIGLVQEDDDNWQLLTDIMGDEDHHGDMDFKVAGTQHGITGIQLDMKVTGIKDPVIRATLEQAKEARIELLKSMLGAIRRPNAELSEHAPRLLHTKIDPQKIGLVIGPGGKMIRSIQEETGAQIDIQDDGTVTIASSGRDAAEAALARVEAITEEIKVGRIYNGKVSSVKDFGAFVEIAPGKDGLCHISELSDDFVKNVGDVCKVGDLLEVKVIAIDDQNRVKLSRKAVLAEAADDDEGDGDEEE